ncbi:hypothetical protein L3Q82_007931 [Scortum barcoo]|uniref:Uncharacterized protein n=1 Tax=Scortum barcoo TaxID=214431 RepID=A0ACB8WK60_9TELE|nr:hypothetical protein L3Q82_007931 [Scortum barcoo]
MGEQPIFSARAHVFQIDPATKRNWLPASKHAVTVSFFYDASRSVYRIISVGGTKAIINSTITPNMTFTKTSQKFGQWADSRANTVYGLGFSTEQQLQQFAEQFKEVKEAARLAREKSQERFELANPALNIAAPEINSQVEHQNSDIVDRKERDITDDKGPQTEDIIQVARTSSFHITFSWSVAALVSNHPQYCSDVSVQPRAVQSAHSASEMWMAAGDLHAVKLQLSGLFAELSDKMEEEMELSEERHSPPLLTVNGPGEEKLFRSKSAEVELTAEKERVKKMLSEGSMCEINLEAELFTLQDSNAKLVAALQEANSSVEQWKKQLAEYQEETDRLRDQVAELEAQLGPPAASQTGREELSRSLEELEALLSAKDQARHQFTPCTEHCLDLFTILKTTSEIYNLQSKKTDVGELEKEREEAMQRLQDVERRNTELEERVQSAEKTLASSQEEREQAEVEVQRIIEVLDVKICDLNDLRQSLAKLIDK